MATSLSRTMLVSKAATQHMTQQHKESSYTIPLQFGIWNQHIGEQ